MNNQSRLRDIKRSQKESLIFKIVSNLYMQASIEDKDVDGLMPTRASLSSDKSACVILFYDPNGIDSFKQKLERLKLYKPSIRKSLADEMKSRYVPEIKFAFDAQFEKEKKVNDLLDRVKEEDKF